MTLDVTSNYTSNQLINLTSPEANFIISPSSVLVVPGSNSFIINLIPFNGFSGATTFVLENTDSGNIVCQNILDIMIPACDANTSNKSAVIYTVAEEIALQPMMRMYPNPAAESVSIDYENYTIGSSISIYDLTGRKLAGYNTTGTKGAWSVNTSSFPSGLYVVVVKENDTIITQQKLIIK
jgi:hypothetical protein